MCCLGFSGCSAISAVSTRARIWGSDGWNLEEKLAVTADVQVQYCGAIWRLAGVDETTSTRQMYSSTRGFLHDLEVKMSCSDKPRT